MGLWYLKDTGMSLTSYSDADHTGCQDTRRSTSGCAQFLGDKLVSWSSKKQKSTLISSTEAEYISLSGCCFNNKGVEFKAAFPRNCVVYAFGISLSCSYSGNAQDEVLTAKGQNSKLPFLEIVWMMKKLPVMVDVAQGRRLGALL
ncbi:uncharacterized mitochondrial protein-like protein [Tanacetum coccineum]